VAAHEVGSHQYDVELDCFCVQWMQLIRSYCYGLLCLIDSDRPVLLVEGNLAQVGDGLEVVLVVEGLFGYPFEVAAADG